MLPGAFVKRISRAKPLKKKLRGETNWAPEGRRTPHHHREEAPLAGPAPSAGAGAYTWRDPAQGAGRWSP